MKRNSFLYMVIFLAFGVILLNSWSFSNAARSSVDDDKAAGSNVVEGRLQEQRKVVQQESAFDAAFFFPSFHSSIEHNRRSSCCAIVLLVMGNAHVVPAIVSVRSIRTSHDLLVFTTNLSVADSRRLEDEVVKKNVGGGVYALQQTISCPHRVTRRDELHEYQQRACTKLPLILSLVTYKCVLYIDADVLMTRNVDSDLFDDVDGVCARQPFQLIASHTPSTASEINTKTCSPLIAEKGTKPALNGGVMLIKPAASTATAFVEFLDTRRHLEQESPRADQLLTAEFFFARQSVGWLGCQFNYAPWNTCVHEPYTRDLLRLFHQSYAPPALIHYSGKLKVWSSNKKLNALDLIADDLCREHLNAFVCVWNAIENARSQVDYDHAFSRCFEHFFSAPNNH